jgi:hypothetical protein
MNKSRIRVYSLNGLPYYNWRKKMTNNSNRNLVIALASVGFATQTFVLICGDALAENYANVFNAFGSLALFVSFVWYVLDQPSADANEKNRSEIYRDMESVYRYIDDVARDLRDEIRDSDRNASDSYCSKNSRK